MIKVEANYDNLAALMILDKSMERIPEPFRMQQNVNIIISFEEFKKFIENSLRQKDYLLVPTKDLKSAYNNCDDKKLYSYFMLQMAVAVSKELYYSTQHEMYATTITHSSAGTYFMDTDKISKTFEAVRRHSEVRLRTFMSAKDYEMPTRFNPHNWNLWAYANVLYYYSTLVVDEWEVCL